MATGPGNGVAPLDAPAPSDAVLSTANLRTPWRELALPAASLGLPELVSTPIGWLALSRRQLGDAEAPSALESYLYRSEDGIRWEQLPIVPGDENLALNGIAYGAGHYVLSGIRSGGLGSVLFTSSDAVTWTEQRANLDAENGSSLHGVVYGGRYFFGLSTSGRLLVSKDGARWTAIDFDELRGPSDVTYGHDRYLLVGSGAPQFSIDAVTWAPAPLDCGLPGACIQVPELPSCPPGGTCAAAPASPAEQSLHTRAVFAAGRYYIDQASSSDAQTWQALPDLFPETYVGGSLVGRRGSKERVIWQSNTSPVPLRSVSYRDALAASALGPAAPGDARLRWSAVETLGDYDSRAFPQDQPLPDALEFPLADGEDCMASRCVLAAGHLYLLP